jgi:hypothetical protein
MMMLIADAVARLPRGVGTKDGTQACAYVRSLTEHM